MSLATLACGEHQYALRTLLKLQLLLGDRIPDIHHALLNLSMCFLRTVPSAQRKKMRALAASGVSST